MAAVLVPPLQLLTTGVLDMLRTGMAAMRCPVHDHGPTGEGAPALPYAVLYAIPGGGFDGPPLTAPESDVHAIYQVTVAAGRRDQCQLLADKVRSVWTGRQANGTFDTPSPVIAGWVVADRIVADAPAGVEVDGAAPRYVFSVPQRFGVTLTPA